MNVLIIGSGGREHAIAWKIKQSPLASKIWVAPGNAGTIHDFGHTALQTDDHSAIIQFCEHQQVDCVLIGPEAPLVDGLADALRQTATLPNLIVIGPGSAGARLEGSKEFAKAFMLRHQIPTAKASTFGITQLAEGQAYLAEMKPPFVLKADGLAAGKGVIITEDLVTAKKTLEKMLDGQFGQASSRVLVEEFMQGVEFSVFALVSGKDYVLLPEAKDYKRVGDGDTGLNTGGMGAISPVPFADSRMMQLVETQIVQPTVAGLAEEGIGYCGFIYFGLMNVSGKSKVVEYNVRLGDPETQVILPRLSSDLLALCVAAGQGQLAEWGEKVAFEPQHALTVVLASDGYPLAYEKGKPITLASTSKADAPIFHAGTKLTDQGQIITSGGRVMTVTGLGNAATEAREKAYEGVGKISFEGKYFRQDIGMDILKMGEK